MRAKPFLIAVFLLLVVWGLGAYGREERIPDVSGEWDITIRFVAGTGHHTALIEQEGGKLSGIYRGGFLEGKLTGTVKGDSIDFTGHLKHESTAVRFHFTGTVLGDTMKGAVDMGEYWSARWTARRKRGRER